MEVDVRDALLAKSTWLMFVALKPWIGALTSELKQTGTLS